MKLSEIVQKLKTEFPGEYASVEFTATSFGTGNAEIELTLYIGSLRKHLSGGSVDELIQAAKILLNKNKAKDVEVEL